MISLVKSCSYRRMILAWILQIGILVIIAQIAGLKCAWQKTTLHDTFGLLEAPFPLTIFFLPQMQCKFSPTRFGINWIRHMIRLLKIPSTSQVISSSALSWVSKQVDYWAILGSEMLEYYGATNTVDSNDCWIVTLHVVLIPHKSQILAQSLI